jgi:hypothetical protein
MALHARAYRWGVPAPSTRETATILAAKAARDDPQHLAGVLASAPDLLSALRDLFD